MIRVDFTDHPAAPSRRGADRCRSPAAAVLRRAQRVASAAPTAPRPRRRAIPPTTQAPHRSRRSHQSTTCVIRDAVAHADAAPPPTRSSATTTPAHRERPCDHVSRARPAQTHMAAYQSRDHAIAARTRRVTGEARTMRVTARTRRRSHAACADPAARAASPATTSVHHRRHRWRTLPQSAPVPRRLHLLGGLDAEQAEPVGQHPGGHVAQTPGGSPGCRSSAP